MLDTTQRFHRLNVARIAAAAVLIVGIPMVSGCKNPFHRRTAATVSPVAKPASQTAAILPVDLTKVQPNEAGMVPILEYHDLVNTAKATGYQYSSASFRKDMEWLYAHNYRPVSLSEYVQGRIDCPAGMSPVILTFDDALKGQFYYTPDGKIDPTCAVGILDDMHARHPDWPLKGTFFVLTNGDPKLPPSFYQEQYAQGKMEYLVKEGYEIGNHTIHHRAGIRHWSDDQVMAEFAGAVKNIQAMLPNYNVNTLALPFGVYPKNQKLVIDGQSGGVKYHNICALLAGAAPVHSPMSKDFKPYRMQRIIPGNEKFAIKYWLDWLERNKADKYVSDGDPNTFTVNTISSGKLDPAKIAKAHLHLRTYNGTTVASTK
ncbi:MAG: polysaccharide deacetylase family protein [Capsulimonas sp.]|uniref:polysaccharide deacetylase family protein n=1 Tax=Capsulimonas sp. TaxID=2494211 RepID=UPI00326781CE